MNPLRRPADRVPPRDRPDAPEATLSIIGLGQLGLAVAAALAANGAAVTVHDRDPSRVALACEQGARAAGGSTQAARADVVVTLLPDDDRLHALVHEADGLLAVMPAGALHLCLGTISVALAGELAAAHRAAGQFFIASPVFGRPEEAWAGELLQIRDRTQAAVTAPPNGLCLYEVRYPERFGLPASPGYFLPGF